MSCSGVGAGRSGICTSNTQPVSAIRLWPVFSPVPRRFWKVRARWPGALAVLRRASGRIAPPLPSPELASGGRHPPPPPPLHTPPPLPRAPPPPNPPRSSTAAPPDPWTHRPASPTTGELQPTPHLSPPPLAPTHPHRPHRPSPARLTSQPGQPCHQRPQPWQHRLRASRQLIQPVLFHL